MKKITLILLSILTIMSLSAQAPKHIKWTVAGKKSKDGKTAEIYFKAKLDPTWHIWSQTPGDDMLIPPTWTFDDKNVKAIGAAKEIGKKISKTEEGFKGKLYFYEGSVIFAQKIQIAGQSKIAGVINYQICDPKSCLPPADYKFSTELK